MISFGHPNSPICILFLKLYYSALLYKGTNSSTGKTNSGPDKSIAFIHPALNISSKQCSIFLNGVHQSNETFGNNTKSLATESFTFLSTSKNNIVFIPSRNPPCTCKYNHDNN